MSARGNGRSAFTLVELLVVISIIGMLVAILLPAVQQARESGRRTTCLKNQRELAFAISSYELSKSRYPGSFTVAPSGLHVWPWLPPLLPQLDENQLYDQLFSNSDLSLPANQPIIGKLTCPSRSSINLPAPLSYIVNMGRPDNAVVPLDFASNGIFHDARNGWNHAATVNTNSGYVSNRDGISNTILVSENLDVRQWSNNSSEFEGGMLWLDFPPPVGLNRNAGVGNTGTNYARPSSNHPYGFVVSFCSGSTRLLKDEIDYTVYQRLMTPAGAQSVPGPQVPVNISEQELDP